MTRQLSVVLIMSAVLYLLHGCSNGDTTTPDQPVPPAPTIQTANYLPQTPSSSSTISRMRIDGISSEQRLAVMSLQGIVNRERAEIYTNGGAHLDEWVVQLYKNKGYITSETVYTDYFELIKKYANRTKGVIIYDPIKKYTINLAVNLAGVEDCIVVSPDISDRIKALFANPVVIDLRANNFADETLAWDWYFENVFPKQNHSALAVGQPGEVAFEMFYDYVVEFKLPLFWIPGPNDSDYSVGVENRVRKLFSSTPDNIPVLGFWPSPNGTGLTEADGVGMAGQYGKYTIVNTYAGNYSYHSGVRPSNSNYIQTKPRAKAMRQYDPSKKYIALIMIESGDAPCYFMYNAFNKFQWNDPQRGEVPLSYGITSSLRMLAPAVIREIYDTQTANDFFFMSISGAGYCYPLDKYATRAINKEACLTDYFSILTQKNMTIMDHDMMGMHSISTKMWSNENKELVSKYIVPMKGLKSIISGMHRMDGYTAANSHYKMGEVSVHHTITFWAVPGFAPDDLSKDNDAVAFIEKEIKTYGADGNFIQAMFLSWEYGPRRLKKLQDKLEKENYVFVTLNEFDHLWRQSNK